MLIESSTLVLAAVILAIVMATNMSNANFRKSHLMILLGSGGHTGEMIAHIKSLDCSKFAHITFVYTQGDKLSKERVLATNLTTKAKFVEIPRARRVGEGLVSTIISSLKTLRVTVNLVARNQPSIFVANGPGTSVIIAYLLWLVGFLKRQKTVIIYVESLARVNTLSLSGKLIRPIADRFIVQWQELAVKYKGTEYYGLLL